MTSAVTCSRTTDRVSSRRLLLLVLASVLAGCAPTTGVLDLSWSPPAANVDGTRVTNIQSYRIYYGTEARPCPGPSRMTVAASEATAGQTVKTRLTGLKVGEVYYLAVTAVSANGVESACSAPASGRARKPD